MNTPEWEPVIIAKKEGYKFELSFKPDDMNAKGHFVNDCGWSKDEYNEIRDFYWFVACITPIKGKIRFDSCAVYLGGNCYKNKKQVLDNGKLENILSGYAPQMIDEALDEIKEALNNEHLQI